jgi:hypothetical protein
VAIPVRAWIRQPEGIVTCLFAKLQRGMSQDVAMTTEPMRELEFEKLLFEGDPRISVERLPIIEIGSGLFSSRIRISRNNEEGSSRLARGHVVATMRGRSKEIRVPLVASLLD